jgi:nicotinic acid phosphoribosyltransferase
LRSLLDTDFYKLLMLQMIGGSIRTSPRPSLINRTKTGWPSSARLNCAHR